MLRGGEDVHPPCQDCTQNPSGCTLAGSNEGGHQLAPCGWGQQLALPAKPVWSQGELLQEAHLAQGRSSSLVQDPATCCSTGPPASRRSGHSGQARRPEAAHTSPLRNPKNGLLPTFGAPGAEAFCALQEWLAVGDMLRPFVPDKWDQ